MPAQNARDLPDKQLIKAVNSFLKSRKLPLHSEYEMARVDLNGDNRRDGIILFKLPHTHWCGWDGCTMVIFKENGQNFSSSSIINGVRGPIRISDRLHKGWKEIIIRVSGTNMRDKNIALRYNGRSYPDSPILAPTLDIPLSALNTHTFFR
ncbi:MAG: hypothetical protein MRY79_02455 [Alphaproteobacteria bacterium]|nr:hypothetical protein [Alphaproteobacteria bacterium]